MILNVIKRYDLEYEFYVKQKRIYGILTSILSFNNRSLTISIFSCSIAKYNAVWYNYIRISSNYMNLNIIKRYDFKFY